MFSTCYLLLIEEKKMYNKQRYVGKEIINVVGNSKNVL